MTVAELIAQLNTLPPDLPVLVRNYNDAGLDLADLVTVIKVGKSNEQSNEFGQYYPLDKIITTTPLDALVITTNPLG